jgi:hypothetical protein
MPKDAVVRVDPNSAPAGPATVPFDELPTEEQAIVQTAIEEGLYHTCPDLPESVRSFAGRLDSEEPSLGYDGGRYGLWVRIEDLVYADTASSPATTPSCGLL